MLATPEVTWHERALVDLSLWLARTAQYSASHPACRQLAEKTHASVSRALAEAGQIVVGVVKDEVLIGGASTRHPTLRNRIGPCLHERGIMVLRVLDGVPLEELAALVDILNLPAQTVFDRGGVQRLAMEAGLARVQIEELAHDVTVEEREAQRRKARLSTFFKELLLGLLARHDIRDSLGEHILELLEHPEIAVAILEAQPGELAEATAGLALMVRQEELRSGLDLDEKLRKILLSLSPRSRDKVLIGLPTLVDEFRTALGSAFDGLSDREVAAYAGPTLRAHADDLDVALYALAAAVPRQAKRLTALRWAGLSFLDWPGDDPVVSEALATMAQPVEDYYSFWSERAVLRSAAEQALAAGDGLGDVAPPPAASWPPAAVDPRDVIPAFDGRRSVADLITMATRTRTFDRFCEGLPAAADAILADESAAGVIGILRGLASAAVTPEHSVSAAAALGRIAASSAPRVLSELEAESAHSDGESLEELGLVTRLLTMGAPGAVLDRLDESENRKMRRILLDALSRAGLGLLPLIRPRLASNKWFVVRNAVLLLSRIGGSASDYEGVLRHSEERVRLEVVRAVRTLPADEAATSILVRMLSDTSVEIRNNACLLLRGDLLSTVAVAELQRIVVHESTPDAIRLAGVEALSQCPRDEASRALYELLHPSGLMEAGGISHMRDLAAVALKRAAAPAAAELFAKGLASSVRRVRRACERANGVPG